MNPTDKVLHNHYRCPEGLALPVAYEGPFHPAGYFKIDGDTIAYGRLHSTDPSLPAPSLVFDSAPEIALETATPYLPFDPAEIVANLQFECYREASRKNSQNLWSGRASHTSYRMVRRILPVSLRRRLQRFHLRNWEQISFPRWPVDSSVETFLEKLLVFSLKARGIEKIPFIWFWPEGRTGALIMTHDVETASGLDFCRTLMEIDGRFGIPASFQLIPEERYTITDSLLGEIRKAEFEVNVHDLNHDGHLYDDHQEFLRRAEKINHYCRLFGAQGFRAGILYRNLHWYDALEFRYDMSVPNVGHLDPQRGGCCTVRPYFVGKILEIPLTMTQDYSLFHILGNYSIELWKRQISLVLGRHGLISFNVHPDYIIEEQARRVYQELLEYLTWAQQNFNLWVALPGEVNAWWRQRQQMRLVQEENGWRIKGPGAERARLAYAQLNGERITYQIAPTSLD